MTELYNMVIMAKKGDILAVENIINLFEPAILSNIKALYNYNFINKYDIEDNKQELILTIINSINVIPIENPSFYNDGCIINYINRAIKNKRLEFLNKYFKKCTIESQYEFDFNLIIYNENNIDSDVIVEDLVSNLNENEKNVIKNKFLLEKSDVEIGHMLNISRQAVNKTKNRALKKLRNII